MKTNINPQELTPKKLKGLKLKANTVRQLIISSLYEAGSGHPGGSLGMADIFVSLYFIF